MGQLVNFKTIIHNIYTSEILQMKQVKLLFNLFAPNV